MTTTAINGSSSFPGRGAGAIGLAIGGLVVATAEGGLGTGRGLGGGVVAITLGVIRHRPR
jgi:Family of unknown function (DUF6223)